MLRAEFSLPSITDEEATPERKAPIRVKFEIPYFTVSGIQVCLQKIDCFIFFIWLYQLYCFVSLLFFHVLLAYKNVIFS